MNGDVHFDGDPATDSARRHMERVLKGQPSPKWPWLVAALGGGGLLMLWRLGRAVGQSGARPAHADDESAAGAHRENQNAAGARHDR